MSIFPSQYSKTIFVELSVSFYQMLMSRCANAFRKMSLEKEYDAYPNKYNIIFCEVSRPSIFCSIGTYYIIRVEPISVK